MTRSRGGSYIISCLYIHPVYIALTCLICVMCRFNKRWLSPALLYNEMGRGCKVEETSPNYIHCSITPQAAATAAGPPVKGE